MNNFLLWYYFLNVHEKAFKDYNETILKRTIKETLLTVSPRINPWFHKDFAINCETNEGF